MILNYSSISLLFLYMFFAPLTDQFSKGIALPPSTQHIFAGSNGETAYAVSYQNGCDSVNLLTPRKTWKQVATLPKYCMVLWIDENGTITYKRRNIIYRTPLTLKETVELHTLPDDLLAYYVSPEMVIHTSAMETTFTSLTTPPSSVKLVLTEENYRWFGISQSKIIVALQYSDRLDLMEYGRSKPFRLSKATHVISYNKAQTPYPGQLLPIKGNSLICCISADAVEVKKLRDVPVFGEEKKGERPYKYVLALLSLKQPQVIPLALFYSVGSGDMMAHSINQDFALTKNHDYLWWSYDSHLYQFKLPK